jgi:hypothetical protein
MRLRKKTPGLYELETVQGQQALVGKRVMKETKKERKKYFCTDCIHFLWSV